MEDGGTPWWERNCTKMHKVYGVPYSGPNHDDMTNINTLAQKGFLYKVQKNWINLLSQSLDVWYINRLVKATIMEEYLHKTTLKSTCDEFRSC